MQTGIVKKSEELGLLIKEDRVEDLTRLCTQLKRVDPNLVGL